MDDFKISRAAERYAASLPQDNDRLCRCREDFIAGAKWALSEPRWTDPLQASPADGEHVLIRTANTMVYPAIYVLSAGVYMHGGMRFKASALRGWMPVPGQ